MITIREASIEDREGCAAIQALYTTRSAWQIMSEGDPERMNIPQNQGMSLLTFYIRQVRLPQTRVLRLPSALTPLERVWDQYDARLVAVEEPAPAEIHNEEDKKAAPEVIKGYLLLDVLHDQQQGIIKRLLVDRAARGRGAGKALVRAARAWAMRQGLETLMAQVPMRNVPGIEFYQKRGFRICGLCQHFYPTREDALFLVQTV